MAELTQVTQPPQDANPPTPAQNTYIVHVTYYLYMDYRTIKSNGAFIPKKDEHAKCYLPLEPKEALPPLEMALETIQPKEFRSIVIDWVSPSRPEFKLLELLQQADKENKIQWQGLVRKSPAEDTWSAKRIDAKKKYASFVKEAMRIGTTTRLDLKLMIQDPIVGGFLPVGSFLSLSH